MYVGHFDFTHPLHATVADVLPHGACAKLIADYEPGPWLDATVNSAHGRVVDSVLRDNTLAMVRDGALASRVYGAILPHVPARMSVEDGKRGERRPWAVDGLYVPLRIYRYAPGQHFGPHQDQSYARDDGAHSLLTLLVYLNDDFEGGETEFLEPRHVVKPRTGSALWFQHMVVHAGRRVVSGTKYILRTDVVYRPAE